MTREAFERALDAHLLQTKIYWNGGNGPAKWYTCRRNGRTQVWTRDGSRFEIPIKYRFKDTMRVTNRAFETGQVDEWFRIAAEPPTEES